MKGWRGIDLKMLEIANGLNDALPRRFVVRCCELMRGYLKRVIPASPIVVVSHDSRSWNRHSFCCKAFEQIKYVVLRAARYIVPLRHAFGRLMYHDNSASARRNETQGGHGANSPRVIYKSTLTPAALTNQIGGRKQLATYLVGS
jgi:hypothetical protein